MITWDVDDRSLHPFSRLYVRGMWWRRDKEAFEGAEQTRRAARRRQREGDVPPTRLTRVRRRVRCADLRGMTVWTAAPRRRAPQVRVLYLHGGGYVHPLTADYWRLVRALVRAPAEVVVPCYPLAPDASVDDVVPRLCSIARQVGTADLPLVLMGDSAGGAMALVVARLLADEGGPVVAGVVCLSPWLDATLDEEEVQDLEASDPMLAESGLRAAGRWWAAPREPSDPVVSPQHVALDGLPPVDVLIGDRDILRPAVERLADRARTADVQVHVHETTSMFHVWMTRAIPEGRRTRRDLVGLLRARSTHRAERGT